MEQATTIGLDIVKHVFQVHGADVAGHVHADSDEVARAFRDDVARDYEMMSPGITR